MFGSTMLLTIGQALDRAKDEELSVRIHVGGEWISGRILTCDAQAVAVLESSGDLCVVRKETISCVRMPSLAHTAHVASQQYGAAGPQPGILEHAGAIHV